MIEIIIIRVFISLETYVSGSSFNPKNIKIDEYINRLKFTITVNRSQMIDIFPLGSITGIKDKIFYISARTYS